jgi:hypothetical protein
MPKTLLTLLFSLLLCPLVYSQKKRDPNQRDSSIIIFSETPRSAKTSKKLHSGENNVIKIAPLGFLKGSIPIFYERRVNDFFTIQAGAGVTTRNYIRGVWANALDNEGSGNKYVYTWKDGGKDYSDEDEIYGFEYRTAKTGYSFSLQPRVYFESEAPDGSFLGLSFDSYRYNFQSMALVGDGSSTRGTKTVDEYEKLNDIMVLFGYQNIYDRLSLEYTTGIGIRNIKGEKYAVAMNNNGQYVDGLANYKKTTVNFEFSIKVGYHF